LTESLQRGGVHARLEPAPLNGLFYVRRHVSTPVCISVAVVGPGDRWQHLFDLDGIEIQDVVYVGSGRAQRLADLPARAHVANSIDELSGEYLLWIDGESSPTGPDSVLGLLEHLQSESVAVTGGMTVRGREGEVLQAGLAIGDRGQPAYAYAGLRPLPQPNFYLNLKDLPHEVSATYSGCCAMRRATWQELGGWRADLPPPLAIADLCLRALDRGHDVVYTPIAQFQSERALPALPRVEQYDWTWHTYNDPFWNPNLTPTTKDGLPFRYGGNRYANIRQCTRLPSHRAAE